MPKQHSPPPTLPMASESDVPGRRGLPGVVGERATADVLGRRRRDHVFDARVTADCASDPFQLLD